MGFWLFFLCLDIYCKWGLGEKMMYSGKLGPSHALGTYASACGGCCASGLQWNFHLLYYLPLPLSSLFVAG